MARKPTRPAQSESAPPAKSTAAAKPAAPRASAPPPSGANGLAGKEEAARPPPPKPSTRTPLDVRPSTKTPPEAGRTRTPPEGSRPARAADESGRPAKARTVPEARAELVARGAQAAAGGLFLRSDPLADARAAQLVVSFVARHTQEFSRRGLSAHHGEAALTLARELEDHLKALPAAAVTARGRSQETAELLADAASTAHAVREAVLRVSRGPDGRSVAHAFGLGEPFSARQPAHVQRALRRILEAAKLHPQVAGDAGLVPEDLRTMKELAEELASLGVPQHADEASALTEAQGGLRAYFDLVAAKATVAFLGDPDERARLLAILPRADERRHQRRNADEAPAAEPTRS